MMPEGVGFWLRGAKVSFLLAVGSDVFSSVHSRLSFCTMPPEAIRGPIWKTARKSVRVMTSDDSAHQEPCHIADDIIGNRIGNIGVIHDSMELK